MRDTECVTFLQWALPRMGMRWAGFRKVRRQVCRRVARRVRELGLAGTAEYGAYLEAHPDEWVVLDSFCRITISRFYRDHRVFEVLGGKVLPRLAREAAASGGTQVRCWSAGCASGEEVYTLKILWAHYAAERAEDVELSIVATDADGHMLDRARRGRFGAGSLTELPAGWVERYLEPEDGGWRVPDRLRDGVQFIEQDIRLVQPEGAFHVILCRNLVFTYLEETLQQKVLAALVERLSPAGVLVIGKQEALPEGAEEALVEWAPHTGIYRRVV